MTGTGNGFGSFVPSSVGSKVCARYLHNFPRNLHLPSLAGDPGQGSRVVSKLVTVDYNLRQCNYMFPNADGTPGNYQIDADGNNVEHEGWNLMVSV
jgi:hypothetical protein